MTAAPPAQSLVLIQEIATFWTKASRGAAGATARNGVPRALVVPASRELQALEAPREPVCVVHAVRYGEANHFRAPLSNEVRVQPAADTFRGDNIAVSLVDNAVRVSLAWGWGAPMRHPVRSLLTLGGGQWGRVRYNRRSGGYGGWLYSDCVYNIGLFSALAPDVFVSTGPDKDYEDLADLW